MEIKIPVEELRKRKLFVATPMYGGMATGMFTRSIADLSALCAHYGIQLQMYFLFNESLITRARNYCVDEFLRSDATHLMFIDSDIGFDAKDILALLTLQSDESPYDIIGGPYPKKSHHKDNMVLTEKFGWKTIRGLVEEKYTGRVASLGKHGKIEWKSVISHSKLPHKGAPWVKIQAANQKGDIITADHPVATLKNPLKPYDVSWIEARFITPQDYVIRLPNRRNGKNNENGFYNPEQISYLIGTLLGDGSIDSKGYLKFGHASSQEELLSLKAELFGGIVGQEKQVGTYKTKEYKAKFLYPPRNAQISYLRDLMYIDGKKSVLPILDYVDDRALAMWYMDDGSLTENGNGFNVRLCSESFGQENEALIDMLSTKFGISSTINKCNNGDRIRISSNSYERFFTLITPYVIPSMRYKIPVEYHHIGYITPNFARLDICAKPVTVEQVVTESDQYDITVEDNHNFVSNHYVVSNCISWEKIKMAVDKGFADEDPSVLDRYVGDYVFNPKHANQAVPLGEPVEVLEIGTGFMMIRRKTLEAFAQAFPQYSYKPDHVRTQHFDGSREIMQFFQAEIDPKSKRYLSEDYWFCQKMQELNMKTWLCPWMRLAHTGTMTYGGSLIDLAQLGASATADIDQLKKTKKSKK